MTDARHDRIAERLEEYVLGQLTAADDHDVETHLRACAVCAGDVRELTEVLGTLGEAVPSLEPPAALKQRVLSSVASVAQEPATGLTPFHRPAPARRSRWLLAAAAVAIVGLGAALAMLDASRRSLTGDVRRANASADELRDRLRQHAGQTDLALSILTAPDLRELPLAGRENATAAAARAYWSATRGLLVVADRLPAPPPGRIYQVWVIEGGQPMNAGLLGEPASGRGMLVAPPPRSTTGAVTVAITDEPPGGLAAPSGTIRLVGSI